MIQSVPKVLMIRLNEIERTIYGVQKSNQMKHPSKNRSKTQAL